MFMPSRCHVYVTFAATLLLSACGRSPGPITPDPGVTFAAHLVARGFVVDRLRDGGSGTLEPPGLFSARRGPPTYLLQAAGGPRGGLWVVGQSRVLARPEPSTLAPVTGEAIASWNDGAISLSLHRGSGPPWKVGPFARQGGGTGPSVLSRNAQTVLDVRGNYRAALRDAGGAEVGWLRVRVSPYQRAARIYDAVLPDGVDDGLAAAAVVLLDEEIDWIEAHAIDVYRGTGEGPLDKSVDW